MAKPGDLTHTGAMRAVAYQKSLPISDPSSLVDIELPDPVPTGRELLVEVRAIAVNPVDTKVRLRAEPAAGEWKVLGWDVAGVVRAVGPDAVKFAPGDEVFYAGALGRPGANSELHVVDEHLVGRKPSSLGFAEAAALPLTSVTAWEMLFERLHVKRPILGSAHAIVIVGGAGGVGSVAIQLARQLTDLIVIATASRPETQDWVRELGAHHVIDHEKPLAAEIAALGLGSPGIVFSTTHTDRHVDEIVKLLAPQGRLGLIDDPETFDIVPFKQKSLSVHWELMFTRSMFDTVDLREQGVILDDVSRLIDAGTLRTTLGEHLGRIDAANLKQAHALLESGRARGKLVLEGFR